MSNKNQRVYIISKRNKNIVNQGIDAIKNFISGGLTYGYNTFVDPTLQYVADNWNATKQAIDDNIITPIGNKLEQTKTVAPADWYITDSEDDYVPFATDYYKKHRSPIKEGNVVISGKDMAQHQINQGLSILTGLSAPTSVSSATMLGAGMALPYAVDYANKYNMFGASDNQKEMASDLAAFMPIGGIGKKFINPRTFKYNFYPKQYATTAMRRDVARNEINKINQLLNVKKNNTSLNINEKIALNENRHNLNKFLDDTNNIEKFYLPNRIKNYKNIFTNYNGTINPTVPFTPNINSINITNRINRVNNALANTQRGTKRFEILMQEKNRLNTLRNDIKPDLFDNNTLVNYIANNPKTAYATAGMISTLPLLYPSDTTSVNATRPPINAQYPTSSNTTVPSTITSTNTARVSNRDTTSISRKDTVRTNRTDTTSNKNYVKANTKQDTATVNRNNNRNSSNNSSNNSNNGSSGDKNNTSSSKTNEEFTKDTNNTNTQNTTKTKKKFKKQRRKEAEQQAKLAQLRQAMAEANSKVLDDVDKEMYYYGRRGPVYMGNRSII